MKFTIEIGKEGFSVKQQVVEGNDEEPIASGSSASDLLGVFNQILWEVDPIGKPKVEFSK